MSEHVYKLSEVVGTSSASYEKAIEVALERTKKSVRNVRWFEVINQRGYIHADRGIEYQVTLKVGFQMED